MANNSTNSGNNANGTTLTQIKKLLQDEFAGDKLDTRYFGENHPMKTIAVAIDEMAANVDSALKKYEAHFKRIDNQVTGLTQHWMKVDAAASQYAKTIGATEEGLKRVRHEALKQGAWN